MINSLGKDLAMKAWLVEVSELRLEVWWKVLQIPIIDSLSLDQESAAVWEG
jgi:hypothetical protein